MLIIYKVERTAHAEEGFNPDSQIVYHFGYKTINENPQLYRRLISILTDTINLRCEKIRASKKLYKKLIIFQINLFKFFLSTC